MIDVIIVIACKVEDAEDVVAILDSLDPPSIPHFAGTVQIAVDENARTVVRWLDEGEEDEPPPKV